MHPINAPLFSQSVNPPAQRAHNFRAHDTDDMGTITSIVKPMKSDQQTLLTRAKARNELTILNQCFLANNPGCKIYAPLQSKSAKIIYTFSTKTVHLRILILTNTH
jgi:hypothetical protein